MRMMRAWDEDLRMFVARHGAAMIEETAKGLKA
jgi:hypothetical protein